MCIQDDVDTPHGVDIDSYVDIARDGEDEEDDEDEDEKEEEEEEVVVDKVEEEDEDNGKEPRTIGQGEMANTLAANADTW
jgi:hypothetical protein